MDMIEAAADIISQSKKLVVFTGAGISTESGIPDFRSPGGVWSKFDPNEYTYQKFLASEENRVKAWERFRSMWELVEPAEPNRGHNAIAEFHRMGKLDCVITQNVDALHQKSGIPDDMVIELHGTMKWVDCLECGRRYSRHGALYLCL